MNILFGIVNCKMWRRTSSKCPNGPLFLCNQSIVEGFFSFSCWQYLFNTTKNLLIFFVTCIFLLLTPLVRSPSIIKTQEKIKISLKVMLPWNLENNFRPWVFLTTVTQMWEVASMQNSVQNLSLPPLLVIFVNSTTPNWTSCAYWIVIRPHLCWLLSI